MNHRQTKKWIKSRPYLIIPNIYTNTKPLDKTHLKKKWKDEHTLSEEEKKECRRIGEELMKSIY